MRAGGHQWDVVAIKPNEKMKHSGLLSISYPRLFLSVFFFFLFSSYYTRHYSGKIMHICTFALCLVIVLWALIHLTEFVPNEGNWQVRRQNSRLPNHQLRKLPEGKLDLRLGSVKSDRMKAELEKTFGGDT